MENGILVNRVANSSIQTINLESLYPKDEMVDFDLKEFLFKELMLKEKDFRASMKEHDWSQYKDKIVLVNCSSDAIIPVWAYMLVATYLESIASIVWQGDINGFLDHYFVEKINSLDLSSYHDGRVIIKGCSEKTVPPSAYLHITNKLKSEVKSLMYGEPCSTVPVYKKPKV